LMDNLDNWSMINIPAKNTKSNWQRNIPDENSQSN
jgi:hypothetical protein